MAIAGPTGTKSTVLANGALPKNVIWYVGSNATILSADSGIMVETNIDNCQLPLLHLKRYRMEEQYFLLLLKLWQIIQSNILNNKLNFLLIKYLKLKS